MAGITEPNQEKKKKKWTVMVYFAGDNNLSEEMIYAIKEMYRVGVTGDVDVVVQFDPSAIGAPVRRYEISQEQLAEDIKANPEIASAVIQKAMAASVSNASGVLYHKRIQNAIVSQNRETDPTQNLGDPASNSSASRGVAPRSFTRTSYEQTEVREWPHHRKTDAIAFEQTEVREWYPHYRKTDTIAIDVDGSLEKLGILLPMEGGNKDEEYRRQKEEFDKTALSLQQKARPMAETVPKGGPKSSNENSADPNVLKNFIFESMRDHPAEHYMVVLSGHGSGAVGDFLPDSDPGTTDKQPSSLSIPRLNGVFERVKKRTYSHNGEEKYVLGNGEKKRLDILGMDSCLMSMAEVAYELKDNVELLVGSEGFVEKAGWPYHRILEALIKEPGMSKEQLAKTIVKRYISYYSDYGAAAVSTDQSVVNVAEFKGLLIDPIQRLSKTLISGLHDSVLNGEIVLAHWEAQSYNGEQYTDLYDFCDRLQVRCLKHRIVREALQALQSAPAVLKNLQEALNRKDDAQVSQTANEVLLALEKPSLPQGEDLNFLERVKGLIKTCQDVKQAIEPPNVVLKSCYTGSDSQHSHGLSVFFPWSEEKGVIDMYKELKFAKADTEDGAHWAEFLGIYLEKTRRRRRNQADHTDEPVRIGPPHNPAVSAVPLLVSVRSPGHGTRGLSFAVGGMKNPPDGFYRDKCEDL